MMKKKTISISLLSVLFLLAAILAIVSAAGTGTRQTAQAAERQISVGDILQYGDRPITNVKTERVADGIKFTVGANSFRAALKVPLNASDVTVKYRIESYHLPWFGFGLVKTPATKLDDPSAGFVVSTNSTYEHSEGYTAQKLSVQTTGSRGGSAAPISVESSGELLGTHAFRLAARVDEETFDFTFNGENVDLYPSGSELQVKPSDFSGGVCYLAFECWGGTGDSVEFVILDETLRSFRSDYAADREGLKKEDISIITSQNSSNYVRENADGSVTVDVKATIASGQDYTTIAVKKPASIDDAKFDFSIDQFGGASWYIGGLAKDYRFNAPWDAGFAGIYGHNNSPLGQWIEVPNGWGQPNMGKNVPNLGAGGTDAGEIIASHSIEVSAKTDDNGKFDFAWDKIAWDLYSKSFGGEDFALSASAFEHRQGYYFLTFALNQEWGWATVTIQPTSKFAGHSEIVRTAEELSAAAADSAVETIEVDADIQIPGDLNFVNENLFLRGNNTILSGGRAVFAGNARLVGWSAQGGVAVDGGTLNMKDCFLYSGSGFGAIVKNGAALTASGGSWNGDSGALYVDSTSTYTTEHHPAILEISADKYPGVQPFAVADGKLELKCVAEPGAVVSGLDDFERIAYDLDGTQVDLFVRTVKVETIETDKSALVLDTVENKTGNVTATAVLPEDATYSELVWTSDDETVATVSGSGSVCTVTAVSAGDATITVKAADRSSGFAFREISVTVNEGVIHVDGIEKTTGFQTEYDVGQTIDLGGAYTVTPANAVNKAVTFSVVTGDSVAVDGTSVKAVKPGESVVRIVTEDGNFEISLTLAVRSNAVVSVAVKRDGTAVTEDSLPVGGTLDYSSSIEVLPANAFVKTVTFTSSDETVLKVEDAKNGVLKALKEGTATITVKSDENPEATCAIAVTVLAKVDSIEVAGDLGGYLVLRLGSEVPVPAASAKPAGAFNSEVTVTLEASAQVLAYKSGATGILEAKGVGNGYLIFKADTFEYRVRVYVAPFAESIDASVEHSEVMIGYYETILTSYAPSGVFDGALVFETSNAAVATVDTYGRIKGVSKGTVTITVKLASDETIVDTIEIKVIPVPVPDPIIKEVPVGGCGGAKETAGLCGVVLAVLAAGAFFSKRSL